MQCLAASAPPKAAWKVGLAAHTPCMVTRTPPSLFLFSVLSSCAPHKAVCTLCMAACLHGLATRMLLLFILAVLSSCAPPKAACTLGSAACLPCVVTPMPELFAFAHLRPPRLHVRLVWLHVRPTWPPVRFYICLYCAPKDSVYILCRSRTTSAPVQCLP